MAYERSYSADPTVGILLSLEQQLGSPAPTTDGGSAKRDAEKGEKTLLVELCLIKVSFCQASQHAGTSDASVF